MILKQKLWKLECFKTVCYMGREFGLIRMAPFHLESFTNQVNKKYRDSYLMETGILETWITTLIRSKEMGLSFNLFQNQYLRELSTKIFIRMERTFTWMEKRSDT